tara:strand:+ start:234 stop:548 length:315 start_codon:yes stop_codon:yes gene_type:complete
MNYQETIRQLKDAELKNLDLSDDLKTEKEFNAELQELLKDSSDTSQKAIDVGQRAANLLESKEEAIAVLQDKIQIERIKAFNRTVFHSCVYFMIFMFFIIKIFS